MQRIVVCCSVLQCVAVCVAAAMAYAACCSVRWSLSKSQFDLELTFAAKFYRFDISVRHARLCVCVCMRGEGGRGKEGE